VVAWLLGCVVAWLVGLFALGREMNLETAFEDCLDASEFSLTQQQCSGVRVLLLHFDRVKKRKSSMAIHINYEHSNMAIHIMNGGELCLLAIVITYLPCLGMLVLGLAPTSCGISSRLHPPCAVLASAIPRVRPHAEGCMSRSLEVDPQNRTGNVF